VAPLIEILGLKIILEIERVYVKTTRQDEARRVIGFKPCCISYGSILSGFDLVTGTGPARLSTVLAVWFRLVTPNMPFPTSI
jgi:hypothetical protein